MLNITHYQRNANQNHYDIHSLWKASGEVSGALGRSPANTCGTKSVSGTTAHRCVALWTTYCFLYPSSSYLNGFHSWSRISCCFFGTSYFFQTFLYQVLGCQVALEAKGVGRKAATIYWHDKPEEDLVFTGHLWSSTRAEAGLTAGWLTRLGSDPKASSCETDTLARMELCMGAGNVLLIKRTCVASNTVSWLKFFFTEQLC